MNTGLLIAVVIIVGLAILKLFLKTLKAFLFIAVIAVSLYILWLCQPGFLFH